MLVFMLTALILQIIIMEIEDSAAFSDGLSDSDSDAEDFLFAYDDLPKLQIRARWKEDLGMAEIVSNKGKLWTTTGIVRGGKIYIFLEDTLFLVEIGALHLLNDEDNCIPLEDIYKKVAKGVGGSSFESFEVYKHLKSLGYIIKRHGVSWSMKRGKSEESCSLMEFTDLFSSLKINDTSKKPVFDVYSPNSKFRKSNPGDLIFVLCISGNPPSKKQIEDIEGECEGIPLKFCYVEHGRVSFFSFNQIELPNLP